MTILSKVSFLAFLLIALVNQTFAQNSIQWTFDEKASTMVSENIPNDKALLVFESSVNLTFDSSIENLEQPAKKSGKYYLYVNTGPQAITIKYNGNNDINFGMPIPGSLPALKNKDVRYFKVNEIRNLVCEDITDAEIAKGNSGVPIGVNVSDALVVINVYPPDLVIQVTDNKEAITKQSREDENYKVFVKSPGSQEIYIKYSGFNDKKIILKNLTPKETRFYRIIKLSTPEDYSKQAEASTITGVNDFSKILGYWGGSLGETETYFDLNQGSETGQVVGKIYQKGLQFNLSGMMRMKSNEEYRMTLNQQGNNSSAEAATLDLIFKKGIGNGVSISESGKIQDITVMRVKNLPKDDSIERTQHLLSLKKQMEGIWSATSNSVFTSISIDNLDLQNKIQGTVNLLDEKKCNIKGVLSEKNDKKSLVLNFQDDCGTFSGTLIIKINLNSGGGTFISNDGMTSFSTTIFKL